MKAGRKKAAKEDQRCDESPTPHLPDHILIEIFCRLPIKTLMAVKCVSRSWLRLVSGDTHFAELHRRRSPTELLLHRSDQLFLGSFQLKNNIVSGIKRSLFFNTTNWSYGNRKRAVFTFVNSCNGLLCFRDVNCYDNSDQAMICNPVTNEFIIVPRTNWGCVGLHILGLGFSRKENRYKLLMLTNRREKSPVTSNWSTEVYAEICTLEKGTSWRNLGNLPLRIDEDLSDYPRLFFEGKLHFQCPLEEHIDCFDFDNEQFGKVSLPSTSVDNGNMIGVRVLGGRLSVTRFGRGDCIEIWVMKEYGVQDSWTKAYTVRKWVDEHGKHIPLMCLGNDGLLVYEGNEQVIDYSASLPRLKDALAGYEARVWNGNSR